MKKSVRIIAAFAALVTLFASLALSASAKIKTENAVGAIVYVKYTDKAPNMEKGVIDESWGDVIHIDKDTQYCGMWANMGSGGVRLKPDDTECDLYFLFDDEKFYIAIWTPDSLMLGGLNGGDAVCFNMEANNKDLVYKYQDDLRFFPDGYHKDYRTFGAYVEYDDASIADPQDTVKDFSWEEVRGGFIIKWAITWKELGVSKKEVDEGCLWNFCFTRSNASDPDGIGDDGWLYWGKWFDISLAKGAASTSFYVADSPNAKGPNTWIFSKLNTKTEVRYEYVEPGTATPTQPTEPEQPTQPTTPTEQPSDWAKAEVDAAIAAGLVPEALRNGYKGGTSRETLSKLLSVLLDKVYGKAPEKTDAAFSDTTDADVLKAANLGIINGYANGDGTFNFKPANTLKRSEMTAIINRVAKLCGKTVDGFDAEVKFADTASHWCNKELGWAVHQGIVKGTSATTFSPENTLTVEQSIMMIFRTFEALK